MTDEATLRRLADAYASKYGEPFTFTVGGGAFRNGDSTASVFEIRPIRGFGFGNGATPSARRAGASTARSPDD